MTGRRDSGGTVYCEFCTCYTKAYLQSNTVALVGFRSQKTGRLKIRFLYF